MKRKAIAAGIVELVVLLILPLVFVNLAAPHEFMGIMILLFFVVNPIAVVNINAFVGKDIKKLWWFPLSFAIVFLLSYWLILEEIIWDLTIYAGAYIVMGFLAMVVSWIVKRK